MEDAGIQLQAFKWKVECMEALYEELKGNDRSIAREILKDLVKNCEAKLNNGDQPVAYDKDIVTKLQCELEQFRKENIKLKDELNKLSLGTSEVKILKHRKSKDELRSPEDVVAAIINDILLRVVPPEVPVRRRPGRPRKEVPKVDPAAPAGEPVVKRRPGRPRKIPLPDSTSPTASKTSPNSKPPPASKTSARVAKRKYVELGKDNVGDGPDIKQPCLVTEEVHVKPEDKTTVKSARLRAKRSKNVPNTIFSVSDDDVRGPPAYFDDDDDDDDDDSDVDMATLRERRVADVYKPKLRIKGLGGTSRKRGRPRKHPIRDPSTIKKHKKIVRHVCQICNAQFLHGRPFHRHLSMRHDAGRTSCLRCRKEFENHAHYLHHKCESTRNRHERVCKRCNATFKGFKKLQDHVQMVHGLKNIDPIYFCKYCQKGFIRKPSLIHHLKVHADGQHVCDKCGKFSGNEEDHRLHLETHWRPSTGSLHCERCGAVFDRRQQFDQHIAAHEKYDCTICNQVFSRKKMLLRHVRDSHGIKVSVEEKKHVCEECNRSFNRPGQLEIHMRVHTGERPIECPTCKMFFKSTKALWKHCQTHTHLKREGTIPLEKDHLCSMCGKSYFRKQALQRHMRYHTENKPYKCPHCAYRCRDGNNLKRHISLHFSSRQFVCEICGSAFHAKKTLETHHMYKHSSDRQHKCPVR